MKSESTNRSLFQLQPQQQVQSQSAKQIKHGLIPLSGNIDHDYTYNEILDIYNKIVQSDPTLAASYEGNIRKYTPQQIEKIIINLINKAQQKQQNRNEQEKIQKFDKAKQINNWNKFYKEYYNKPLQYIGQLGPTIGIEGNKGKLFGEKVQKAIFNLNIEKHVFYNPNTRQIELLDVPNKQGTGGKKLTMKTLRVLISQHTEYVNQHLDPLHKQSALQVITTQPAYLMMREAINGLSNIKKIEKSKKKIKNWEKNTTKKTPQQLEKKLHSKFISYLRNPQYKYFVDSKDVSDGWLNQHKLAQDAPVIQQHLDDYITTEQDRKILNLQQNLRYVPQDLQEQFNQIINTRGQSSKQMKDVHPSLKRRYNAR